jgi:hypothetical protein
MKGHKLDKVDFFGLSDPFLIFSRAAEDGTFVDVHKTEVRKFTLNPDWMPFSIKVNQLCNNDYERPIRIQCMDWNRSGNHTLIGSAETNLREMLTKKEYNLKHPKKRKPSGTLKIDDIQLLKKYTFMDYLFGGCEISLIVSIDFTASNGDVNDPRSLHYLRPGMFNEYQAALRSVGDVLAYYDADKKFPAFGFGAKLPTGQVSHCFVLNGNPHMVNLTNN